MSVCLPAFRSQLHRLMDFNISSLSLFICKMREGVNGNIYLTGLFMKQYTKNTETGT